LKSGRPVTPEIQSLWQSTAASLAAVPEPKTPEMDPLPAQYLILITCRDEKHQTDLLQRLAGEGLECKALLS
jgi:hypothetical protein